MKLTILSLLLSLAMNCLSQTISGKVIDIETKMPLANASIFLLTLDHSNDTSDIYYKASKKYKILRIIKTDSLGKFNFTTLTPKVYSIIAEYKMSKPGRFGLYGIREDSELDILIKPKTNYYKKFSLLVTCPFDKTKDQLYCPRCKKTDKILPIQYGLPIPIYDSLGNELDDWDKYHSGGCVVDLYCNPTKHCDRCKLSF